MEKVKVEKNKSITYLLPIFANYVKVSYFRLLANTYLWYDDYKEETFCLLYKFDGRVRGEGKERFGFTVYEETILKKNPLYLGSRDFGQYVLFKFELPEKMFDVRNLFIEGKYSKFPEEYKNMVMEFTFRYYGINEREYLRKVFTKDERLREQILDNLGPYTVLPAGSELSSSPYPEKEMFANYVDIEKKEEKTQKQKDDESRYLL